MFRSRYLLICFYERGFSVDGVSVRVSDGIVPNYEPSSPYSPYQGGGARESHEEPISDESFDVIIKVGEGGGLQEGKGELIPVPHPLFIAMMAFKCP